jgi:hypothetical protein
MQCVIGIGCRNCYLSISRTYWAPTHYRRHILYGCPTLDTRQQPASCLTFQPWRSLVTFFLFSWGGVRLSPLDTSTTNWPIVPASDVGWWWMRSSRWNENWQGKPKYSEKTCPSATLSTINPTWTDLGSNTGCRRENPVTNRLSYGTALGL